MSLESAEPAFAAVARLTAELFFELGESKVMEALIQAPRAAGSPLLQLDEALGTRLSLGTKQPLGVVFLATRGCARTGRAATQRA